MPEFDLKYPPIPHAMIRRCILGIPKAAFSTMDFIEALRREFPGKYQEYTDLDTGWRIAVGKRLSRYARISGAIRQEPARADGAQLWSK